MSDPIKSISKAREEDRVEVPGDGYTSDPTHLRIYWEDYGDDDHWTIDGADFGGGVTEEVARYATLAEVLAVVPVWVKNYNLEPEREWVPMTLAQIKGYLAGSFGIGDFGVYPGSTIGSFTITEVRETEHGVEYR